MAPPLPPSPSQSPSTPSPPSQPRTSAYHPSTTPTSVPPAPEAAVQSTDTRSDSSTIVDKAMDGATAAESGVVVDRTASGEEVIWVDWDGPDDADNPLNWSGRRKWLISAVSIVYGGMVSVNVSAYAFTVPSVMRELDASHELAAAGVTFFTLTFGIAPLLLSPLSELFGRTPIYLLSAFLGAIWLIPQALAKNTATLLIARLWLGVAGSTGINLAGGTLSDLWIGEQRGLPMSLFVLSAFAFTGMGPVMFSFAEARYGFRFVSWMWLAASGALFLAMVPTMKETRSTVLLSRKAARLRNLTGDDRYQTRHDAARGSFGQMMRVALGRPLKIIALEPVVIAFSIWIAFAWGVLYMCLGSITIVFEGVYGWGVGVTGLVYVTQAVGAVAGTVLNAVWFEKLFKRNLARRGPEATLYCAMGGGICFPTGCWIYGLTARTSCHWIGPVIGLTILYLGDSLIFLAVYSYLAASYTLYASSALSAMNLVRNLVAAVFPLFTTQMYDTLGVQNAGILTAALGTALSVIPFLLFTHGARLRAQSPFAKQLARLDEEAKAEAEEERRRRAGGVGGGGEKEGVAQVAETDDRSAAVVAEEEKARAGVSDGGGKVGRAVRDDLGRIERRV